MTCILDMRRNSRKISIRIWNCLSGIRAFSEEGCVLVNIMFHAPMGRFQLELINCFTYFSPSSHLTVVYLFPVGLSSLIRHFQQVLWLLKFLLSPGLGRRMCRMNVTH